MQSIELVHIIYTHTHTHQNHNNIPGGHLNISSVFSTYHLVDVVLRAPAFNELPAVCRSRQATHE